MILELVLALLLGIVVGIIAGLLPGVHANLISVFLVSTSVLLIPYFPPIVLAVFIVAMATCQSFLDFIPSILLGAPDEDSCLSVLPGHQMLLEGRGYEAITCTSYGCLIAIPLLLLLIPLFLLFLKQIFSYLNFIMFIILITASSYLIIKERKSKLMALLIFTLSGILGIVTLNLHLNNSLLPMLSGLFGSSSLITSIMKKQKIPEQKISEKKEIKITKQEFSKVALSSLISTPLCSFLPALGSSQAAIIGSDMIEETKPREFLMLLGSVNIIVLALSFVTLFSINKSRTGSAAAISEILKTFNASSLIIILITILISSLISFFLTIYLARFFSEKIRKINYSKLSIIILIFLSLVVLFFSGFLGFLIYIVSTFTGLTAIYAEVRRTHLMGSMMLTAILFYLPI